MPILYIVDEADTMDKKEQDQKLEAYRDVNLRVSISDGLGITAGGNFPRSLDLRNIASWFDYTTADKSRTLLCTGGAATNYPERDLIHHYSERESIYVSVDGSYILMGFRKMARIFSVMDELMYFVDQQ